MMKHIKIFEDFGTHFSPSQLAFQLEAAVGGLGTDEAKFASLVTSLRDKSELIELNRILSSDPEKYTYSSLEAAVSGELDFMDQEYRSKIENHLKLIGTAPKQQSDPVPRPESLISNIIDRVVQHEGKRDRAYLDSRGIQTIGVGFNLTRQDADSRLKRIGANPKKIKAGKARLTDSQIQKLLVDDLNQAKLNAENLVKNFSGLPQAVQGVLVEMAFNLGKQGLSEFKRFLSYVSMKKWNDAYLEMLRSDWKKQVGDRAQTLADIIKKAA